MSFTIEELSNTANRRLFLCGSSSVQYGGDTYIFGGFDGEIYSGQLVKFNGSNHRFDVITPEKCPMPRQFHAACVLGQKMFIYGGKNGELVLDDLWEYDFRRGLFTQLTLSTRIPALYRHAMCAVSGTEFMIFGGARQNNKLEPTQYLVNPETFQVQTVSDLNGPAPSVGASLTTFVDKKQPNPQLNVYLFGGAGLKGFSQELWRFQNRRWFQLRVQRSGPLARADQSFIQVSPQQILLYAGENGPGKRQKLGDLWAFDIGNLQWQRLQEPQIQPRSQFVSWFHRQALYIAGGTGCDSPVQRDAWKITFQQGFIDSPLGQSGLDQSQAEHQPITTQAEKKEKEEAELSLNDLRKDAGLFAAEKPRKPEPVEQPEERIADTMAQRSQMNLVELRGELEFKLRVLDARLELMQKDADELRHLKQQVVGGRQGASLVGEAVQLREINEMKAELVSQINRQFTNQLLQTEQELTQSFKTLLKDNTASLKQDVDFNTANITRLAEQLEEIRRTWELQSQRANDAIKFDPRIAGFEQQLRSFQQLCTDQDDALKAMEESQNELRLQLQEITGGKSIACGIESLIDEKTSTLKMKVSALEQRVFAAEQNNEVAAFEKQQVERTLRNAAAEGEGTAVLTVMNVTDEAFKQKLQENLSSLGFVKQTDIEALIEKKVRALRDRDSKIFRGQLQMITEVTQVVQKLSGQVQEMGKKVSGMPELQATLIDMGQEIARLKQQLAVVGDVPIQQSKLSLDVSHMTRSQMLVSTVSEKKRVRFDDSQDEQSEPTDELFEEAEKLGLTSSVKHSTTQKSVIQQQEEDFVEDPAALDFYLHQSMSNSSRVTAPDTEVQRAAWNLQSGIQRCFYDAEFIEQELGAVCGQGNMLVVGRGSDILLFKTEGVQDVTKPDAIIAAEAPVTALTALKNAVIAGSSDGRLVLYALPHGQLLQEVCSFPEKITAVMAVSGASGGHRVLCGTEMGQVGVWDLENLDFQPLGVVPGACSGLEICGDAVVAFGTKGFKTFNLQDHTEAQAVEFENKIVQSCVAPTEEICVGQEQQIIVITKTGDRHAIQLQNKLTSLHIVGELLYVGLDNGCIQTLKIDGSIAQELVIDPGTPIKSLGHVENLLWICLDNMHITGLDFK